MSTPFFKPGEAVIFRSRELPEHDGEYTVLKIVREGEAYTCRFTGARVTSTDQFNDFVYLLDVPLKRKSSDYEVGISQGCLKKKYERATDDFISQMKNICLSDNI